MGGKVLASQIIIKIDKVVLIIIKIIKIWTMEVNNSNRDMVVVKVEAEVEVEVEIHQEEEEVVHQGHAIIVVKQGISQESAPKRRNPMRETIIEKKEAAVEEAEVEVGEIIITIEMRKANLLLARVAMVVVEIMIMQEIVGAIVMTIIILLL